MRTVEGYTILEDGLDEIPECQHVWEEKFMQRYINPNREYVVGYGRIPVLINYNWGRICLTCNEHQKHPVKEGRDTTMEKVHERNYGSSQDEKKS